MISILTVLFGFLLSACLKCNRSTRRVTRTIIRHRDPTEAVRDFENEDDLEHEAPLEFEEEVVEDVETLDIGFDYQTKRKKLYALPLDISQLHVKPQV